MNNDFIKEREFVLDLAKKGIEGNIKLSRQQKKYIKNLINHLQQERIHRYAPLV